MEDTSKTLKIDSDFAVVYNESKPKYGKRSIHILSLHAILWLLLTAYIIFASIQNTKQMKDGFPLAVLSYLIITLRLLGLHVCMTKVVYRPTRDLINRLFKPLNFVQNIQSSVWVLTLACAVLLLVLLCVFLVPPSRYGTPAERIQSLGGVIVILGILYGSSRDRKHVPWR